MSNIVIGIPSTKKEILRVAVYCRVSTTYEENRNEEVRIRAARVNLLWFRERRSRASTYR